MFNLIYIYSLIVKIIFHCIDIPLSKKVNPCFYFFFLLVIIEGTTNSPGIWQVSNWLVPLQENSGSCVRCVTPLTSKQLPNFCQA